MPSTRHEQVYHAAPGCQAASLTLTARSLHGLFWACQIESQKNSRFFARFEQIACIQKPLSSAVCMQVLCLLKDGGLIAGSGLPHTIDDSDPDVCQCSHGHTVTLPFCPFPSIIVKRPGFLPRRLPGKLIEHIAKWLQTSKTFMGFGVIAALEWHRSCSSQHLNPIGIDVACSIISPFSEHPWSQAFPRARQASKDGLILMGQKKGVDLLIVGGNVLHN